MNKTFDEEHIKLIISKMEYRFKNSKTGKSIIQKLKSDKSLTIEEMKSIRFEYRFKKSVVGKKFISELI